MADMTCAAVREDLSATLDGEASRGSTDELERHLSGCEGCRTHERELRRVRGMLRLQSAAPVPDLVGPIMERIAEGSSRSGWQGWLRVASVAAVVAALVVAGATSLWFGDEPTSAARADDIQRAVREAARELDTYRATLRVIERGWHQQVPVRDFDVRIWFEAPERFRLEVEDRSAYPGKGVWRANDVTLVATADRWWIREPVTCPTEALPGCTVGADAETRAIVQRQPFDGTSALPTDIILPVETLADSETFAVAGRSVVADRDVFVVRLPYRQAQPLIASLQVGGSWRTFSPSDTVDLYLDETTWFPLGFDVFTSDGSSAPSLEVRARSFEVDAGVSDRAWRTAPAETLRRGGFRERRSGATEADVTSPTYTAGLERYRAGKVGDRTILTYARGMTWLKVTYGPPLRSTTGIAERVDLDEGVGYYSPADETLRRRIALYGSDVHVDIQTNLTRREAARVASSIDVLGRPVPGAPRSDPRILATLRSRRGFDHLRLPTWLPPGYRRERASYTILGDRSVSLLYLGAQVEYEGFGVRITQTPSEPLLPPPSGEFETVEVEGVAARWSPEAGKLEWIERGVYRAIAAPSFDVATAVRIAEGLR